MSKKIIRTNKHHRLSRSRTGGVPFNGDIKGVPNVKTVNYKKHQAFHLLFEDTHPVEIAKQLNEHWVDPNFVIMAFDKDQMHRIQKLIKQLL